MPRKNVADGASDMALPEFVYRRGNRLHYRRAWPKDLWPITGNTSFARALGTSDPHEAARARSAAEREFHARVDALRLQLGRQAADGADKRPALTREAAEAIAVRWFLDTLEVAESLRSVQAPDRLEADLEDAEWSIAEGRRALAEGDLADRARLAKCLRDAAGFAAEAVAEAALVRLLARAAVAVSEVHAGRLLGRYGTEPSDKLFASALAQPSAAVALVPPPPAATPKRTLADLEKAYRADKLPQVAKVTAVAHEAVFRVLRDFLGPDRALASIGHEDGDKLLALLQALPRNAEKNPALRGLPLREQIAEGRRLGVSPITALTVNSGYMAHIGTLFEFARKRGWVQFNPFAGKRARDPVAPGDRRESFGPRLPRLFEATPWKPRDVTAGGKPVRYWVPLLALFHGLRLAEAVGLLVGDIGEEQGSPMLYIRAGVRPLKGVGSRRDLPVHPELVRLGFLEFVEQRRGEAAPGDMLFTGEEANRRGQWGRYVSQWFAAHVRAQGIAGRGLTLHALRHDFRDALREAGVEEGLAEYLIGHSRQGMGAIYGGKRPYSVHKLQEAIAKVRYPGLLLSTAP